MLLTSGCGVRNTAHVAHVAHAKKRLDKPNVSKTLKVFRSQEDSLYSSAFAVLAIIIRKTKIGISPNPRPNCSIICFPARAQVAIDLVRNFA